MANARINIGLSALDIALEGIDIANAVQQISELNRIGQQYPALKAQCDQMRAMIAGQIFMKTASAALSATTIWTALGGVALFGGAIGFASVGIGYVVADAFLKHQISKGLREINAGIDAMASAGYKQSSSEVADAIQDPSGYVHEAVASNRLSGVTATLYEGVTKYDIYGDPYTKIVQWDASAAHQQNPTRSPSRWKTPPSRRKPRSTYSPPQRSR